MSGFIRRWFPTAADYPATRLFSLDLLRGLDMILLTLVGPLVNHAQQAWGCFPAAFMRQFRHHWLGFTLWDLIMPLFIFMCGAAMPFALGKRLNAPARAYWTHVFGRVALLWFLGLLVQGHLAELNPDTFNPYSNTLQAIAAGYLATAAIMRANRRGLAALMTVLLALAYAVPLHIFGYGEFTNLAFRIDSAFHRVVLPASHVRLHDLSFYTWIYTSTMFAVMTLCGYHATNILRAPVGKGRKAAYLLAFAAGLFLVGFGTAPWIPVIKPIFTLSFVAQAMGWCVLALDVLYVLTDILMLRRGTALVLLFGQCALASYFISHFFGDVLLAFGNVILQGVTPHLAVGVAAFAVQVVALVALIAVLCLWRRRAAFVAQNHQHAPPTHRVG